MPLLSIIIPAYNCEKYIETAITSALGQGIADCEIVIVDDGSTDDTAAICREYCQKYGNVRLYTQGNRGASAARNLGISHSTGDYIGFLDADDRLLPDCYGAGVPLILGEGHDVVMFSAYCANIKRDRYRIEQRLRDDIIPGGRLFPASGPFATCIYRRELLISNNIRFAEGVRLNEDQVFKIKALYKAGTIRTCASFSYVYNATPGSIMHTISYAFDRVAAWQEAYEWFDRHCTDLHKALVLEHIRTRIHARMLLYAKNYIQSGHTRKEMMKELERVDGLQMLMSIHEGQVMPYQREELRLFQENMRKFAVRARWEGWKLSIGRLLLRIPALRAERDKRQYPLTIISINL